MPGALWVWRWHRRADNYGGHVSQWQDEIRPINNYMHPADKEIQRLVMPLCGTRTFASKMREQLCYVDEDGHLQPRRDVQWPAFLRYNASKILTKYGKNAQGNDLLDLFSLPAEKVCAACESWRACVVVYMRASACACP